MINLRLSEELKLGDSYLCVGFFRSSCARSVRRNEMNKFRLSRIVSCCSQTRGNVFTMLCAFETASTGEQTWKRLINFCELGRRELDHLLLVRRRDTD